MSHAAGDDQSMSCREMSTVPPHVSLTNGTLSIFIAWDDNAVFSPACFPTVTWREIFRAREGRTRNVALVASRRRGKRLGDGSRR